MKRLMVIIIAGVLITANGMAATHYVVTNGTPGHIGPVDPYTNWATAGTNIIAVVNAALTNTAPRTVWVSNGTYYLTDQVTISAALTLQSVNGREVTIVDGYNYAGKPVTNRCFDLTGSGAVLDGVTISNGYVIGHGGGVYCAAGNYVKNCRITDCVATNVGVVANGGGAYVDGVMSNCEVIRNINFNDYGGGIYANGLVVNCVVASNTVYKNVEQAYGAGIMVNNNGVISNCMIYGNDTTATSFGSGGGIKMGWGATVYNSLVYNNYAQVGGGISMFADGSIQNCTVVSNQTGAAGTYTGGIYLWNVDATHTQYIKNVICYFNNTAAGKSNIYMESVGTYHIVNSCIAPTNDFPTNGIAGYYANNIESNPQFANKDSNDFHLAKGSPCINSGTNENWMTLDLDGHSRIDRFSGIVDMGCYEYLPQGFMFAAP